VDPKKLERGSHIATIAAAVVAAAAFLVATAEFRATQKLERETIDLEREARAVDLFVKYNELMSAAAARPPAKNPQGEDWRGNLAVAIAESIWRLRSNDSGWAATVAWMLQNEERERTVRDLDCSTYDPTFVALAVKTLGHGVCVP
jgi:hypothetical protein